MADFPQLRSGAVAQYGSDQSINYATHTCKFLDGIEQRFAQYGASLRHWVIRLDYLDEIELNALEEFYVSIGGQSGSFAFVDPWDGAQYPNCSFADDSISLARRSEGRAITAVSIEENRT